MSRFEGKGGSKRRGAVGGWEGKENRKGKKNE